MDFQLRLNEIYDEFQGFPAHNSILRFGQRDDAFAILTFEILFNNYHQITKFRRSEQTNIELLQKYIVPPPDDSIDIFFEEIDVDDRNYHIVQVKNKTLTPSEIETAFLLMENTINNYLKRPNETRKNLREAIANTDFTKQYKSSCIYYVVHQGSNNYIRNQKTNYKIITIEELIILEKGTRQMSVPKYFFEIDNANNFIVNNFITHDNHLSNKNLPQSLLCNFNGYELATLNNKYSNTILGRNILYGLNLRESLSKASKTFEKMFETIDNEPELFLFYNNGITLISSYFNTSSENNKEKIGIENFSIINGAQTTSTLGEYLRKAEINQEQEKIEKLKRVFVLTKIYQINSQLINHENISDNIKIFNNTQTPLSSRDLVSIRKEQISLQERLLNKDMSPNVFVFIKKGEKVPPFPKFFIHQRITNEVLAQLALCGFYSEPFNAKDKKLAIFENENKDDFLFNSTYDKIFSPNNGILFRKTISEIDELLFIYKLHTDTKNFLKSFYKDFISRISQTPSRNEFDKDKSGQIDKVKRDIEIANACLFYNITTYYEIKDMFDSYCPNIETLAFNYAFYYENKNNYRENLKSEFRDLCYNITIETIRTCSKGDNVVNWLRLEKNQAIFLDTLRTHLSTNAITLVKKYPKFVSEFKQI